MADANTLFALNGKIALVTGGSRGLGRAMVLAFARAGADVVIASRKLAACEEAADEVRRVTGRRALPVACHVGDWHQVEALVETTYREFGRIDILVNNAGMSPVYDRVENVSEELYDKVLDVNLKGPFRLTALVGARMAAGTGGSVIMVSSTAAVRPTPNVIPYEAWDMAAFQERARTDIPLGRGGEADEIVGAALYFASNASSFTTGAILGVHGGVA
jgi:NAD(P)-dependent dehydrogenase (short-subunit alcohol dehydrogenase family)